MASLTSIDRSDLTASPAAQAARARSQVREAAADARRDRAHFTLAEDRQDARQADAVAARRAARQAPQRVVEEAAERPSAQRAVSAARAPSQQPGSGEAPSAANAGAAARPEAPCRDPDQPRAVAGRAQSASAATPASSEASDADDGREADRAEGPVAGAPVAAPVGDGRDEATPEDAEKSEPTPTAEKQPSAVIALPTPSTAGPTQVIAAQPPAASTAAPASTVSAAETAGPRTGVQARSSAGRQTGAGLEVGAREDAAETKEVPEGAAGASPRPDREAIQGLLAPASSGRATESAPPSNPGALPRAADAAPPTPLRAVPIEVGLKALEGASRFDIRLDPEELGRIDVRLEIDQETKRVRTHLTVDRPETLQLLQRDAGLVEQAIVQAGLTPSPDGLGLALRDPGGGQGQGQDGGRQSGQPGRQPATDIKTEDAAPAARLTVRPASGLDIRI